ncbi:MAG: helix-turn-helix protein [Actinomycetia bacterium]|nr:helix-turn-helix protein [Actinomycetes bacterium]
MSADFYTRLEQRRGARPSEQTVAALSVALRLTDDERDHLLRLAGHEPRPRGARTDHVSPALLRVLDRLDAPAQVVSDLGVTLKQNPLAEELLGVQTTYTGLARSQIYRWFLMPEERLRFLTDDHEMHARSYTAHLRAALGRNPDDIEARSLLDALHRDSPEFTELWNDHEVGFRANVQKGIVHPNVGVLTLDCQILTAENQLQHLAIFTAVPGSEDAERLAFLSVIGNQRFEASRLPPP